MEPDHPLCSPARQAAESLATHIRALIERSHAHGLDPWQLEDSLYALTELAPRLDDVSFLLIAMES